MTAKWQYKYALDSAYEYMRKLRAENARLQKLTKWLLEFCHSDDSCGECEFRGECETEDNTDDYGFPMTCVAYDRILTEARELLGHDAVARYEKDRREG